MSRMRPLVEVLVSSLSGISGGASWKILVTLERQHSTGKTFTDGASIAHYSFLARMTSSGS